MTDLAPANADSTFIYKLIKGGKLGSQTGNAIVDVLFGDYNPSVKLPDSFLRSVGQMTLYYNHYFTGYRRAARMLLCGRVTLMSAILRCIRLVMF